MFKFFFEYRVCDGSLNDREREQEMRIWTANRLESKNDIFQRGIFRFFWCLIPIILIGGSAAILSYRQIVNIWWLVLALFVITVVVTILGILIDFKRLNKKQKT
jgi:hypothetical protein